ncbi:glycosyltransferase [Rhodococcus sp. NPDC060086]|uniref:glycosyltransferase n=1 Tax=Rhodococcus sp. NPDC060086 TaxID=3347055 RepID=UPI003659FA6F
MSESTPSTRRHPAARAVHRLTAAGAVLAGLSAVTSIANTLFMPRLRRPDNASTYESVVVCIPARNEQETVPRLITDLRAQTYAGELRVFVLDDASSDETRAAALCAADGDPRVTVVSNDAEPSPGWTGKSAACRTLADIALTAAPRAEVIAFVDADVRLSTDAIAAAVTALRAHHAALVCPWPEQHALGVSERLLQPMLSFSWMSSLFVPLSNRSLRASLAVACGQFLMFDTAAYRQIGGHESVASSPTEDLDIARALRRRGRRTVLVSGAGFVSCRMYRSWTELRAGYTRWLWSSFGGKAGSAAVLGAALIAYLLPPAAALLGSGSTRRLGAVGYLAAVVARTSSARSEAGGPGIVRHTVYAGAHPVSTALFATLVLDSHRRRSRNQLSWKSRPLHAPRDEK